jgi:DNA-binding transcriptional ArsR family regulator
LIIAQNKLKFDDIGVLLINDIVMEALGYINSQPNLDIIFSALADRTRRALLTRLADGEASVNEIAAPFEMSQPAVSRHLKVLERAGVIERYIDQQRRPARLKAERMALAVDWLSEFGSFWDSSFNQLEDILSSLKEIEAKEPDHE